MASLGTVEAYMEQWLKTATKGNVRFTMAFLTNRMHLHCDVCNIGLTCAKPKDATDIDFAIQEYVKLHAHTGGHGDEWQCKLCGRWTKEPLTGPSGHGTTCTAVVPNGSDCTHKKADGGSAIIKHTMLGDKKKLQQTVGELQQKADEAFEEAKFDDAQKLQEVLEQKKAQLQKLELAEVNAKILWAKSQLKNVPIVVEHTPPKPAAPTTDVFEDKGRRFR